MRPGKIFLGENVAREGQRVFPHLDFMWGKKEDST